MNETFRELTGRKMKNPIPLSKLILAVSRKPLFFEDTELINLSKRRNKI